MTSQLTPVSPSGPPDSPASALSALPGAPALPALPGLPAAPALPAISAPAPERPAAGRLLIAAARLPPLARRPPSSTGFPALPHAETDAALLAAMGPLLAGRRGSLWIGAPDLAPGPGLARSIREGGAALRPVALSAAERASCDDGFVQRALWPLFHDQLAFARFEAADWQAFRALNRKFARTVAQGAACGGGGGRADLLWAHDPLLIGLAAELRRLGAPVRATYFLRLPFPAVDTLLRLPWREGLLAGLLAFDRLGFQTRRDLANFLDSVRRVFRNLAVERRDDGLWSVAGRARERSCAVTAGVFPEGIDAAAIGSAAATPEVERRQQVLRAGAGARPDLRGDHGDRGGDRGWRGYKLALAMDSLSPEQGTAEKLRAFAAALELRPALRERASLLLVVEPGRLQATPAAQALRREIERLVGEINGRLGRAGWVPVQYRCQRLDAVERLALYRAADVALVTPLRAGMSLEAKEYCAADVDLRGTLVLSEFSGAAEELGGGALLVNPHDLGATARALATALRPGGEERRRRMASLREQVRAHDVFWWLGELLPEVHSAAARADALP
jgi:trehalose-6-phosphate synthase